MNPLTVHRWAYELTGGRIGHRLGGGVRAALLTTTGRKTGLARTVPLACFRDGPGYVFVASNHGSSRPPGWLVNAQAKPEVQLQVGPAHLLGTARVVPPGDPDYARLWQLANDGNHGRYQRYQAGTSR
ncbi:MAG TPA: nitroreductase/quinone reductase family protein, partial [Streptosporangiaceae bacterium]